jgi:uncharacterized protein YjbJ (UPF0337 family)
MAFWAEVAPRSSFRRFVKPQTPWRNSMNSDEIRGKWNQMKGSVKQQWAKLTDDDLSAIDGQRDRLIGKIQERYGIAREEAERRLHQWKMPQHEEVVRHEEVTRRKVS